MSIPSVERLATTSTGTYGYRVFIPMHWNRNQSYPVIVFLHGSGPRGNDNHSQTRSGIHLMIEEDIERFPAIVIFPQCRENSTWVQQDMEEQVLVALDQTLLEFDGDHERVYLTGLSMGGTGTWSMAKNHPNRWAAIAPCCGLVQFRRPSGIDPADPYMDIALKVSGIPTWVFHGEADTVILASESRQIVGLLYSMQFGAQRSDLKYTEYPDVGHNSWDYAYKEESLLSWFLSHNKGHR